MAEIKLNRRNFLKASALTVVAAAVQACAQPTPTPAPTKPAAAPTNTTAPAAPTAKPAEPTKPAAPAPTNTAAPAAPTKPAVTFKEAPMLADLVKAGKLPPLDQRLPQNPCVCPTLDGIGKYGGVMRRQFNGVSDGNGPRKVLNEGLTWYNKDLSIRPNLAESWQVNKDGSQWTFKLRKGTKWSDGQPYTTDNIKWYYDNVLLNKDITPAISPDNMAGNPRQVFKLDVADAYTFTFNFSAPKTLWLYFTTRSIWAVPSHYVKQFHANFAADKAAYEKTWKDLKFATWVNYWADRQEQVNNPDLPVMWPWVWKQPIQSEIFMLERNPYFWQVDSEGNQLPYIDKVQHRMTAAPDVLNMWIVNGEIDFQSRNISFANYTLYKQSEAKSGYKVFVGVGASHNGFNLNLTSKNKPLREFFQTRDCRIALSLAINRAQVNDLLLDGMGVPRQYSPMKESPQYYEKATTAYTTYDVKKANDLLDAAGYSKKGADGFRLYKDGSGPVSFIIEGTTASNTPDEDAILMVCKMWQTVGVKVTYKYSERSLYTQHYNANEVDASNWGGDRTLLPLAPGAPIFLGVMVDRPWCNAWGFWRLDPTNPAAEEPPKDHWIRTMWDIWDNKVSTEPDLGKQTEYFKQILDIWATECPMVMVFGETPTPIIVKNGMKGYLNGMPFDDTTEDENLLNPQTNYWDDPKAHGG